MTPAAKMLVMLAAVLLAALLLALLGSTVVLAMAASVPLTSTRYPSTVRTASLKRLVKGLACLKPAANNSKLSGKVGRILKGLFRGARLYSLTLIERATCPTDCPNLLVCYGDNMRRALRYRVNCSLYRALEHDCRALDRRGPYAVRLHVLGDFPSGPYVTFWWKMLATFPRLHIFGYTHRRGAIGRAINRLCQAYPTRAHIMQSTEPTSGPLATDRRKAHTLPCGTMEPAPGSVLCPAQTGRTAGCETCGLCMSGAVDVSFRCHCRRCIRRRHGKG
jgi:hypothetical protein